MNNTHADDGMSQDAKAVIWYPLSLDFAFTPEQHALLLEGFDRGGNMDYRWHIYIEDDWLHLDRSWTKFPMYKVHLALRDGKYCSTEAYISIEKPEAADDASYNSYHADTIKEVLRLHIFDREIE